MTFLLPPGMKGLTDLLELGNADKIGDFVIFHMFQKPFRRESMKKKNSLEKDENSFEMAIKFKKSKYLSVTDRWRKRLYSPKYRNSRPEVFFKKSVPKSLVKFRGKHMCRNLFLIKLESHSLLIYWKKKRSPQLFSCELFKIITKHLQETVPKNKREFY